MLKARERTSQLHTCSRRSIEPDASDLYRRARAMSVTRGKMTRACRYSTPIGCSKFRLFQVLFELARFHAPSTIFLDELESLMSQRGTGGGG